MLKQIYPLAKRVCRQAVQLGRESMLSKPIGQARDFLDGLAIKSRQSMNKGALDAIYLAVVKTPPLPCNGKAEVEVHTLTAHHHLLMYLTAVKSLLRFCHEVAVVVHDDGSLDANDRALLVQHVPGLRIIDRAEADGGMADVLARYPGCRRLRERVVNAMELFDNILFGETERLINMNSDVLFLAAPAEVEAWIASGDRSILGVYEEEPAEQREFLSKRACSFPPHVTTALTCFPKRLANLELIETALAESRPDWFTAQNVFPLLYDAGKSEHPARFLEEHSYQASGVFAEGAVFRHYWTSTGRFTAVQRQDASHVIRELCKV